MGLELIKELDEDDEQVIRLQRFQYTVRKQAEELLKEFLLDGSGREQLLGCLKALNILCPSDAEVIIKR